MTEIIVGKLTASMRDTSVVGCPLINSRFGYISD